MQAAKAVGIAAAPSASAVTCAVTSAPAKGALINSVAHLHLTDFHPPNVTSVIDAATNSPLPNAANKNAAAKLQEQLMFGAAQRITSAPSSTAKTPQRNPSEMQPSASTPPALTSTAPGPTTGLYMADQVSDKVDMRPADGSLGVPALSNGDIGSPSSLSNAVPPSTNGVGSTGTLKVGSGEGSTVAQSTAMTGSSASFAARKQTSSPFANPSEAVQATAAAVAAAAAAVGGVAGSRSPPVLQPGPVPLGAIAVQAPAVLPPGSVYSGKSVPVHPLAYKVCLWCILNTCLQVQLVILQYTQMNCASICTLLHSDLWHVSHLLSFFMWLEQSNLSYVLCHDCCDIATVRCETFDTTTASVGRFIARQFTQ